MSAILVKSVPGGFSTALGNQSLTTTSVGYGSDTAAGNLLVCVVYASNELVEGAGGSDVPQIQTPVTSGYSTPWSLAAQATFPTPPNPHDQFESGAAAIYYIANAPVMSGGLGTTVTLPATGGNDSTTYAEFDLYEFSGIAGLATAASTGSGIGGSPQTPDLLTPSTCLILDVMNSMYVWEVNGHGSNGPASPGYTLGISASHEFNGRGYNIIAQTQYILNEPAGSINTTWPITDIPNWCCVSAAFSVIKSATVTPAGVNISTATGQAYPGFQGVRFQLAVGNAFTVASSNAPASGVSLSMGVEKLWAGLGLNYGNVVAGSSGLPLTVTPTNFYVRWTGYIFPYFSGQYTIGVNSEDGCNLTIGSQLLIDNLNTIQSANSSIGYTQSSLISLTAGVFYPIVLEWQHGVGPDYECQLIWTTPGGQGIPKLIPAESLTGAGPLAPISGMLAGSWWNATSPLSLQITQTINAQLKVRLTTTNSATTPIFTGASLDNR